MHAYAHAHVQINIRSFALLFFLTTHPEFFASLIHKFHDPIFFKTLDSDMQYKYNAISVETT